MTLAMRVWMTLLLTAAACVAPARAEAPVEVMILGTYHFESPGLDTHNIRTDSVLGERRQAELQAVAAAVARFRPTRVMVEMVGSEPRRVVKAYAAFDDEMLRRDANEIVQLGFRIARLAGVTEVNGIDVQPAPGGESDYPYGAVQALARTLGREPLLEAANQPLAALARRFEEQQARATIAQLLLLANAPQTVRQVHQPMFEYLAIADGEAQPGAELNARWYRRNARIFAHLLQLSRPGDRVLVVYGFGHNPWLRHFVAGKAGYRLVEPAPYLERAQRALATARR